MQKALTHMNLQLQHVVSDITGATGIRDLRCQSSIKTIHRAQVGNYQPEHVFALSQALVMYDAYQAQISLCDEQIAQSLKCQSASKNDQG